MKKWFVVFMAVALMAAMTLPAAAEPNLTITGEYTAAAMHADGFVSQNSGALTTADDDERDYVYQRFRIQPKFKSSDTVSATLRFDFAEGIWGDDFSAYRANYGGGDDIQVDRAYVTVGTSWLTANVGLQFFPAGQTQVFRDNKPGVQFMVKTGSPFNVRLGWVKADEGSSLSDDADEEKDTDRYLAQVGYKGENFSIDAFGVAQKDGSTDGVTDFEDEPWVVGINGKADFGGFSVHGELAQFGGDNGNEVDYTGTQFNVNGMFKLSETVKLGVDLIYSSAQGDDEQKITYMGNPFAAYDVRLGGTMGWDMLVYGRSNAHLYSDYPSGPLPGDVFDPFQTGAGSIAAGVGAMFTPLDDWTFIGQLHYMTAADDELNGVTGEFEKGYNLLLVAVYNITPKTSLHATYQRVDASFMDDRDPDASNLYGLRLFVAF